MIKYLWDIWEDNNMENENLVYLINKRNEILEELKYLENNSILIGMHPKFEEGVLYSEILNPEYVEREYKKNNDLLKKIVDIIETKNVDINPEEYILKRSDLINFVNSKFNYKTDDISELTKEKLDEILEELKKHIYTYDHNFYAIGTRNSLEKEFKKHIDKDEILNAFIKIFSYITGENEISIADIPVEMVEKTEETRPAMIEATESEDRKKQLQNLSAKEIALDIAIKSNEQYKNTGIICEQEKEIITTMIKSIKETISYEFLNELLN